MDEVRGQSTPLNRVAVANNTVIEVARTLADYVKSSGGDTPATLVLRQQIEKLIESANTISEAVTATAKRKSGSGGSIV